MAEQLARGRRARLVLFGRPGLPPRERWAAISGRHRAGRRGGTRPGWTRVLGRHRTRRRGRGGGRRRQPARRTSARAIDVARQRFGALHGVLHTAGVPGIGLMQFKQPDDSELVLAPKVAGTAGAGRGAADRRAGRDRAGLPGALLLDHLRDRRRPRPGRLLRRQRLPGRLRRPAGRRPDAGCCRSTGASGPGTPGTTGSPGTTRACRRSSAATARRFGITFEEGWRSLLRALASRRAAGRRLHPGPADHGPLQPAASPSRR